jgi:hypothetical protein
VYAGAWLSVGRSADINARQPFLNLPTFLECHRDAHIPMYGTPGVPGYPGMYILGNKVPEYGTALGHRDFPFEERRFDDESPTKHYVHKICKLRWRSTVDGKWKVTPGGPCTWAHRLGVVPDTRTPGTREFPGHIVHGTRIFGTGRNISVSVVPFSKIHVICARCSNITGYQGTRVWQEWSPKSKQHHRPDHEACPGAIAQLWASMIALDIPGYPGTRVRVDSESWNLVHGMHSRFGGFLIVRLWHPV